MNKRIGITIGVVAVIAIAIVLLVRSRTLDDATLRKSLVGKWRALDVANNALHRRKGGVDTEEAEFKSDGTLVYRVTLKPGQGAPIVDSYAWEVREGKLQLRFTGAGSTQDVLPRLRFTVNENRLSMRRRGVSEKVFERVAS